MGGRYVGEFVLKWLADGRYMQLDRPVSYFDPDETEWPVPAQAVVDGASIPRFLWSIVGSPFTGLHRDASVIHDWYCDRRTRPWQSVHRVFYHAMRTSGASKSYAKLRYGAVRMFGPRWTAAAIANNLLVEGSGPGSAGGYGFGIPPEERISRSVPGGGYGSRGGRSAGGDVTVRGVGHGTLPGPKGGGYAITPPTAPTSASTHGMIELGMVFGGEAEEPALSLQDRLGFRRPVRPFEDVAAPEHNLLGLEVGPIFAGRSRRGYLTETVSSPPPEPVYREALMRWTLDEQRSVYETLNEALAEREDASLDEIDDLVEEVAVAHQA